MKAKWEGDMKFSSFLKRGTEILVTFALGGGGGGGVDSSFYESQSNSRIPPGGKR